MQTELGACEELGVKGILLESVTEDEFGYYFDLATHSLAMKRMEEELESYGSTKQGTMFNRFDVYRDDDLPRNQVFCFSDDLKTFAMVQIVDMDII